MKDLPKENAAKEALKFVKPGMVLGLGTGRTANIFIELLGELNSKKDLGLKCIATSKKSEAKATSAGLLVVGFENAPKIDLAVDGADIVSKDLYLLKGLGGALGREKFVAYRASEFVVIVEESKMRERLEGIVPIEVVPFAAPAVLREISALSSSASIRKNKNSTPFKTDNGNYIIDAPLTVNSPEELEIKLNALLGVVENGIFSKADVILIGSENGCRVLKNERKSTYSPFSNKE